MAGDIGYYLVGEAPNQATIGRPDLWLLPDETRTMHTANRLRRIAGFSVEEFLRVFPYRTNLWMLPGRMWVPDGRARAAAIAGHAETVGVMGVVLLGRRVASIYGVTAPEFAWRVVRGLPTVHVPHTSGINLDERARARGFFAAVLESVHSESP